MSEIGQSWEETLVPQIAMRLIVESGVASPVDPEIMYSTIVEAAQDHPEMVTPDDVDMVFLVLDKVQAWVDEFTGEFYKALQKTATPVAEIRLV